MSTPQARQDYIVVLATQFSLYFCFLDHVKGTHFLGQLIIAKMKMLKRRKAVIHEEVSKIKRDIRNRVATRPKPSHQQFLYKAVEAEMIYDYGHYLLPNEIWYEIFLYLPKNDLLKVTEVSKHLRLIAIRILWEKPKFKRSLSPEDLSSLKHLPIKQLCTCDLNIGRSLIAARHFKEIFDQMQELQKVHVVKSHETEDTPVEVLEKICELPGNISIKALDIISSYVTSINTDAIASSCSTLVSQLIVMDLPKLKSITLRLPLPSKFTFEDLQSLNKLPITTLYLWSLETDEDKEHKTLFYPQVALFPEMKFLKSIVISNLSMETLAMEEDQAQALKDLQERGIVVVKDKLIDTLWDRLLQGLTLQLLDEIAARKNYIIF